MATVRQISSMSSRLLHRSGRHIAFHTWCSEEDMIALAHAITEVKSKIRLCKICFNVSEHEICSICRDEHRDTGLLCVVEESQDVIAIERTRTYNGRYHVLGGAINPIGGIGPEQLRVRELLTRLQDDTVTEVIIATNPNLEGEATATYLTRMLSPVGITLSRLASGLPVGGDLEYADEKSPWVVPSKADANFSATPEPSRYT